MYYGNQNYFNSQLQNKTEMQRSVAKYKYYNQFSHTFINPFFDPVGLSICDFKIHLDVKQMIKFHSLN